MRHRPLELRRTRAPRGARAAGGARARRRVAARGRKDAARAPERAAPAAAADDRPWSLRRHQPDRGLRPRGRRPIRPWSRKLDAAGCARVVNAGVSGETSAGGCGGSTGCCEAGGRARPRDRRQRRPAGPGPRRHAREHPGHLRRARPPVAAAGSCSRPWRRRRTTARSTAGASARLSRAAESERRRADAVPARGVAGEARLNQADGIHPTAEGHRRVAKNVWKSLRPLLTSRP